MSTANPLSRRPPGRPRVNLLIVAGTFAALGALLLMAMTHEQATAQTTRSGTVAIDGPSTLTVGGSADFYVEVTGTTVSADSGYYVVVRGNSRVDDNNNPCSGNGRWSNSSSNEWNGTVYGCSAGSGKLTATLWFADPVSGFPPSSVDTGSATFDVDAAVIEPTAEPTTEPTAEPTTEPTAEPTTEPTAEPTTVPTTVPTTEPTTVPTTVPTTEPTTVPTTVPTTEPTTVPTAQPTAAPSPPPELDRPPKVTGVAVTDAPSTYAVNRASLQWVFIAGVYDYRVQRRVAGSTDWTPVAFIRDSAVGASSDIITGGIVETVCNMDNFFQMAGYGDGKLYARERGDWSEETVPAITPSCQTTVHFSVTPFVEAGIRATIVVRLGRPSNQNLTIPVMVDPRSAETEDYSIIGLDNGTLTFESGDSLKWFYIHTNEDLDCDHEILRFEFGNLPTGVSAGSPSTATLQILDVQCDPFATSEVSFSSSSYSVNEGSSRDVFVTLSPATSQPKTIPIKVGGGTAESEDYSVSGLNGGSLTFGIGETSKFFTIRGEQDASECDDETLNLGFGRLPSGVVTGSPSKSKFTISDDEPCVSFSSSSYSVNEGSSRDVNVELSPASSQSLTIPIKVTSRTAESGDYSVSGLSGGSLTFDIGETSKFFTIRGEQDASECDDETVELAFDTPLPSGVGTGSPSEATFRILDDEDSSECTVPPPPPPPLQTPVVTVTRHSSTMASIDEGDSARFVLTANPAPVTSLTVRVSVRQSPTGADFLVSPPPTQVAIASGGAADLILRTDDDTVYEENGSIRVIVLPGAGYTRGTQSNADVEVLNDDLLNPPTPTGVSASSASNDSITVRWNHESGIEEHNVEYRISSGPGWRSVYVNMSSPGFVAGGTTITGLRCGIRYRFRVRAWGDDMAYREAWGSFSFVFHATTGDCVPVPVPVPTPVPPPTPTAEYAPLVEPPGPHFLCRDIPLAQTRKKHSNSPAISSDGRHEAQVELYSTRQFWNINSYCIEARFISKSTPGADQISWSGKVYKTERVLNLEGLNLGTIGLIDRYTLLDRYEDRPPTDDDSILNSPSLSCNTCSGGTIQTAYGIFSTRLFKLPTLYARGEHAFNSGGVTVTLTSRAKWTMPAWGISCAIGLGCLLQRELLIEQELSEDVDTGLIGDLIGLIETIARWFEEPWWERME